MFLSVALRRTVIAIVLASALSLSGCATVGYYYQSVHGHFSLLNHSRPISEVLRDETIDAGLRKKLESVLEMRAFASSELGLPKNDSYLSYAALDRKAVVWSVVATPEFSVSPKQWCFPVVGCASYRGYFARAQAQGYADGLKGEGMDVTVVPNPAYSTLGWFDDPLPSTVIDWPESHLAGLIFHELAHQQLYVADDSAFNEAYAVTIEQVGVERWLRSHQDTAALQSWRQHKQRAEEFYRLLLDTRARLRRLYARQMPAGEMRTRKGAEFARLKSDYLLLKKRWNGYGGFDHWFEGELNNARLASLATYVEFVPAFLKLLQESKGDLEVFYLVCAGLASLPRDQRTARLEALLQ